ncbi:MAG: MFS transporter [Defluviitaleaceae bacterium]|nr:MFS transporter [Defluviitaleaceae bacterium]MCL2261867.1 MFS transporter [Defluviitaleaceae bacterium]
MKKNTPFLIFAVYASFLALGMPDGAFGVAWPSIRYEMGLELERAAFLIIVHSIFYSLCASQTGRLAKKIPLGNISGVGFVLLMLGILGFSLAGDIYELAAATAVLGCGMGLVDSGVNAFAAKRFSAKHMNWLHCFWGMGGAISPVILRQMIIFYDWRVGYRTVFAIQAAIGIVVAVSIFRGLWATGDDDATAEETVTHNPDKVYLTSRVFIVMQWLIFFVYTTFEYSMTFWTVSVLIEGRGVPFETAGLFPAVYLGCLMAGRFVFGYFTTRFSGSHIVRYGLLLSIVGLGVLVLSSNIAGVALVGFGFAPVFPCLMNETKIRFKPEILSKLVGLQIAAAGMGVALSALVMGRILAYISFEALFPTVIICVLIAFSMNEFIDFNLRRKEARK